MKHKEISCPFCRMGFGGYKVNRKKKKVTHLDPLWSYDSGLSQECKQPEMVLKNTIKIDNRKNPTFTKEFNDKLDELKNDFLKNPSEFSKDKYEWNEYFIGFTECYNHGDVKKDDEEYVEIIIKDIKNMYDEGINLYDTLRKFIVKSKNN